MNRFNVETQIRLFEIKNNDVLYLLNFLRQPNIIYFIADYLCSVVGSYLKKNINFQNKKNRIS
jgi:polyhydroxyalkanoate synthesis regulator protein